MKAIKTIKKLEEGHNVTIAALGDSLTYGWLVNKGYLDYFKEMLLEKYANCPDLNIINRGIPGDTAYGGLNRLENDVLKHKPDTVFIQFSLNDAYSGYSPSEFGNSLQEIVERINGSIEAEIILITSIYLGFLPEGETVDRYYDVIEKTADKNNIPVARVHKYWENHIEDISRFRLLVQGDQVHPNEDGYKMMAEALMELF